MFNNQNNNDDKKIMLSALFFIYNNTVNFHNDRFKVLKVLYYSSHTQSYKYNQ